MQAKQGFGAIRKASIGVAGFGVGVLCVALAGCSGSGSAGDSKPVAVGSVGSVSSGGDGATAVSYQPLAEPFSLTGPCDKNSSTTLGMTNCLLV